jgi:hypothetical protein
MKFSRELAVFLVIELHHESGHIEKTQSFLSPKIIGIFGGHPSNYLWGGYLGYLGMKISQSAAHGSLASSLHATETEEGTPLRMHNLDFDPDEDSSCFCSR